MASSSYMEWKYVDLEGIYMFLLTNEYPPLLGKDTGKKANFRRQSSKFSVLGDGELYKRHGKEGKQLKVIIDREERQEVLRKIHEGDNIKGKSANSHFGQDKTENRILEKFWWPGIRGDVRSFIASCSQCQKRTSRFQRVPESVQVSNQFVANPWEQIGVDLCDMPKSQNGLTNMIVAVDYYTKWVEAETLPAKTAEHVSNFLYRLFCRHGCAETHINNAETELVDQVSSSLHDLTGIKQTLTGASDSEANAVFETNSGTVQDFLMKLLNKNGDENNDWSTALPAVLFSFRTDKHSITGVAPFFLMYGRHPRLPDSSRSAETTSVENSSCTADAEPSLTLSQDREAQDSCPSSAAQDNCPNKNSEDITENKHADYCADTDSELSQSNVQGMAAREMGHSMGAEENYQDRNSFGVASNPDLNNRTEHMGYFYREVAQEQFGNTAEAENPQERFDLKRKRPQELSVGDKVLYMNIEASSAYVDGSSWLGPYTIRRQLDDDMFELQDEGTGFTCQANESNLRPYMN